MKKEYEINFGDILKSIWRFKWIVCIVTLLSSVALFFFAKQKAAIQYQATTEIAVVAKDGTGQENPIQYVYLADLALIDYKELVTSDTFAEKVASDNAVTLSKEEVLSAIKVELTASSRIATIKIKANTRENVLKIKEYLTQYAKTEMESIATIKEIKVLNDSKIIEAKQDSSKKYALIGLVVGLIGSILCIVIFLALSQLFKK